MLALLITRWHFVFRKWSSSITCLVSATFIVCILYCCIQTLLALWCWKSTVIGVQFDTQKMEQPLVGGHLHPRSSQSTLGTWFHLQRFRTSKLVDTVHVINYTAYIFWCHQCHLCKAWWIFFESRHKLKNSDTILFLWVLLEWQTTLNFSLLLLLVFCVCVCACMAAKSLDTLNKDIHLKLLEYVSNLQYCRWH